MKTTTEQRVCNPRVETQSTRYSMKWLGIVAALMTISIWAGWMISMRVGATEQMNSFDLALLRYGVTGLILLPVFIRALPVYRTTPLKYLIGMLIGAGLPFFEFVSIGMQYAPVADAGLLITGTFPVLVTFAAVVIFKETLNRQRASGLFIVLIGVVAIFTASVAENRQEALYGDSFFMLAAVSWACFTVCLKMSGLKPWDAAAWLCVVTSFILMAYGVINTETLSPFSGISLGTIVTQLIVQTALVGIITGFSYGYAVQTMGAENTSAIGAFTPALAVLGGYLILGEPVQGITWFGVAFVSIGVLLASGVRLPTRISLGHG